MRILLDFLLVFLFSCGAPAQTPKTKTSKGKTKSITKEFLNLGDLPVKKSVDFKKLKFQKVFKNLSFEQPLYLKGVRSKQSSAQEWIFVLGKSGKLYAFKKNQPGDSFRIVLDLKKAPSLKKRELLTSGEQGLLGIAFDPEFHNNGFVYLNYTRGLSKRETVISRWTLTSPADDPKANMQSEKVLLTIKQPYSNHNGGMLEFGPDKMLYIGMGDGGSANDPQGNSQSLTTLLGKILRIDPRREDLVPESNPLVNVKGGRKEIWAIGLRNPWRFSFDRETGKLWVGDVGQDAFEEISVISANMIRRGQPANLGWNFFEAHNRVKNSEYKAKDPILVWPVYSLPHEDMSASLTGGYVYRGSALPRINGAYFFGDFIAGKTWALYYDGKTYRRQLVASHIPALASYGEDASGEIYAISLSGAIYRLSK